MLVILLTLNVIHDLLLLYFLLVLFAHLVSFARVGESRHHHTLRSLLREGRMVVFLAQDSHHDWCSRLLRLRKLLCPVKKLLVTATEAGLGATSLNSHLVIVLIAV